MPTSTLRRGEHPPPAPTAGGGASQRWFRPLAIFTAVYTYLLIVFGGTVRITGSGMGCGDDWPLCNGQLIPPMDPATLIEYTHRLLAAGLVVPFAALAIHVLRRRGAPGYAGPGGVARPVALAVALLFVQVLLGAITVWLELPAGVTVLHFLTAASMLAAIIVAVVRAGTPAGAAPASAAAAGTAGDQERRARAFYRAARSGAVLGFLVLAMGALTANTGAAPLCQGFPLCNGELVPAGSSLVHIHWTHRLLAYLLVLHVVGAALRARAAPPAVRRATFTAAAAVGVQIVVAAALVLLVLPRWLQALHLAVGAAVWVSLVAWAAVARKHQRTLAAA
ncbi:MAG TPA: COX15/CtaA family protein [Longimicrobiales bacterium]